MNEFYMSATSVICVQLGPRSYPILVGEKLLTDVLHHHPLLLSRHTRYFVIADICLKPLAIRLIRSLARRCAGSVFLRGGESIKDMATLPYLYRAAAHVRLDRQSVVIAIGGGVIGDIAGFFAATYLRGIRIAHIPTTLMAQVDSAIGGKTGVNLPGGKNLIGAFHQPSLVIVDPSTLNTLPEREFRAGLAEVVKYGVIANAELFRRLELHMEKILQRDLAELSWVIRQCCAIKARVVSRDEREVTGLRAILNFGHTIGHGIEAAAQYSLLHGEALGVGMAGATHLSEELTGLSPHAGQRIRNLIQRAGLPIRLQKPLPTKKIFTAMRLDKKSAREQIHFVLAKRIGSVQTGFPVTIKTIQSALNQLQ